MLKKRGNIPPFTAPHSRVLLADPLPYDYIHGEGVIRQCALPGPHEQRLAIDVEDVRHGGLAVRVGGQQGLGGCNAKLPLRPLLSVLREHARPGKRGAAKGSGSEAQVETGKERGGVDKARG